MTLTGRTASPLLSRRLVHALAAASLVLLSGCASLINPYVRPSGLDATDDASLGFSATSMNTNPELKSAFELANKQRKAYYDAVVERAWLRNGLPLLLIPLGAHAMYTGLHDLTDSGKTRLLKEGLLGATAYGLSGYYTSTPREQIYLAGIEALNCTMHAFSPYMVSADLADAISVANITKVRIEADAVFVMTASVQEQIRRFRVEHPGARTTQVDRIEKELPKSEKSYQAARETIRVARGLRDVLSSAAADMRGAIHEIVGTVDRKLSSIEPDPSKILEVAAALAGNAQKFAPGGVFTPPALPQKKDGVTGSGEGQDPSKADYDKLYADFGKLIAATDQLNGDLAELHDASNRLAARIQEARNSSACDTGAAKRPLVVTPAESSVNLYLNKPRSFRVTGDGMVNISLSTTDGPVKLDLSADGFTQVATVTFVKQVEDADTVTLNFTDINKTRSVTLVLVPSPLAPTTPAAAGVTPGANAGAAAASPALTPFEKTLKPEDIQDMQKRLHVAPSGVFDPATRDAVAKWKQENKLAGKPDGEVNSAFLQKLKAKTT